MNCQLAHNLFDAYLDGDLSRSLRTELDAHRLQCAQCRHELALLEVAGHMIGSDVDEAADALSDGFTDRLLACVDADVDRADRSAARSIWSMRSIQSIRSMRPTWFIGGGLAAAAVLAVSFTIGSWRSPSQRVAGEIHTNPAAMTADGDTESQVDLEQAADTLVRQVENTWKDHVENAESILQVSQFTILRVLSDFGMGVSPPDTEKFETLPDSFDELEPSNADTDTIEDL
jgi:anti-sigma factor RsiW